MCSPALCAEPCANGGTCLKPNKCACPPGWTGHRCQTGTQRPHSDSPEELYLNPYAYSGLAFFLSFFFFFFFLPHFFPGCQMWTSAAGGSRAPSCAWTQLGATDAPAETASRLLETDGPATSFHLRHRLRLRHPPRAAGQQWVATPTRVNERRDLHIFMFCSRTEEENMTSFAVHYYFWYALCHSQLVPWVIMHCDWCRLQTDVMPGWLHAVRLGSFGLW